MSDAFRQGQALLRAKQIDAALQAFRRAEAEGADPVACAAERWQCWMLAGRFENAWQESDLISASGRADPHRFWNGESWSGKRLMVRGLHGLGDTIQFIRYAPLLAETAQTLVVQVHPQLTTLISHVPGVHRACTWPGEGLPRVFRSTIETLPASVPYLHVPADRQQWARQLLGAPRARRIGVAWQTGPWNPARSIPLNFMRPLFAIQDAEWHSLQKDPDFAGVALHDAEAYSADVRDTAALVQQMDLVITADTMTAHLAGALGRPVWVLLPYHADWRWMLDREDSPWYPTARLFRQPQAGDWHTVISSVANRLKNNLRSRD